jgi:hypothetical protein
LSDQNSRDLLELLDGTRDFDALVDALATLVLEGKAHVRRGNELITEPSHLQAIISSELPRALERLPCSARLVR